MQSVRAVIHAEVAGAEETIGYQIPTFTLGGRSFVHVAGWKNHVSLYPMPDEDPALMREAAPYLSGKGTVKLPLDRPLPLDLVARLVQALADRRR